MRKTVGIVLIGSLALVVGAGVGLLFLDNRTTRGTEIIKLKYNPVFEVGVTDPNYLLHNPLKIKFDSAGNFYILDQGNSRIMMYDRQMKFLRQYGREGQGPGEIIEPTDFDIDGKGNLYIADLMNRRITILNKEGFHVGTIHLKAAYIDVRLAVSSDERVYVNNPLSGKLITVYSLDGKMINSFGTLIPHQRWAVQVRWNLVSLDFDTQGNLWVAFYHKPLVRKYSPGGNLILEKELRGPEIAEGQKQERPILSSGPYTVVFYVTDILCTSGSRTFLSAHDYIYDLDSSGNPIRRYLVAGLGRDRYFFINRLGFDEQHQRFWCSSMDTGVIYELLPQR